MSLKIGVDKQYRSQPAPARWRGTYRATRRNEVIRQFKVKWTDMFYSERHRFKPFPSTKPSLDSKDHLI